MSRAKKNRAPALQLFGALLPLVVFWFVEEYWGLKAALVVGCVTAVLEVSWEKWSAGKVSFLTLSSNALVLGLGAVSFIMDSGVAFKLQPAVMELGMAVFMLVVRKRGSSFLFRSFHEVKGIEQEKKDALLAQPWFVNRINSLDNRMVAFFVIHGLVLTAVALWGSTRQWILLKGVLFYVLLVLILLPMYKRPPTKTVG